MSRTIADLDDSEDSIVKMLKLGVKGYLSKDVEPKELSEAIMAIHDKGYYYTDFITGKLIHNLNLDDSAMSPLDSLNEPSSLRCLSAVLN